MAKKYSKMYIGEEIFDCTTGFLPDITQINKLSSQKISYIAVNFTENTWHIKNTYKLQLKLTLSCPEWSGYDNWWLHSCFEHFVVMWKHNVNCRMQYFPKENPLKFRNYHKITLNCTIYCWLSIWPYKICRVIKENGLTWQK